MASSNALVHQKGCDDGRTVNRPHSQISYIHIPKTGGSSFFELLAGRFPAMHVSFYDLCHFGDYLATLDFLSGHVPFYCFAFDNHGRKLCTILRNPIDRVISHYRYILTTPQQQAHGYVIARNISLRGMFDHPVLKLEMSDFQTRLLGWTVKEQVSWPAYGQDFFRASQDFNEMLYGCASEEMMTTAAERLSNEVEFALTEDQGSWARLYDSLTGEPLPPQFPRVNVTPPCDYLVSDADIGAIVANNSYDLRLYRFASEKTAAGSNNESRSTVLAHSSLADSRDGPATVPRNNK